VLVVSCDKYADVWGPFFAIFRKRWPDCPYPVFLGSNHRAFPDTRVRSIPIGDDASWTHSTSLMLARVGVPRVILLLEDFLLTRPVDTARVRSLVELAIANDLHCLRLVPKMAPSRPLAAFPGLGEFPPGHLNRVSTQAGVWRTETLAALLQEPRTAWDFEAKASLASGRFPDRFWGVLRPALHYLQSVESGLWTHRGVAVCRKAGVPVDLAARPRRTLRQAASRHWYFVRGDLMNLARRIRHGRTWAHMR
jgi:hypothetical protein